MIFNLNEQQKQIKTTLNHRQNQHQKRNQLNRRHIRLINGVLNVSLVYQHAEPRQLLNEGVSHD